MYPLAFPLPRRHLSPPLSAGPLNAFLILLGFYVVFQFLPTWGVRAVEVPGPDPAGPGRYETVWKSHQNDFKHIYLGALVLRSGGDPYDREQFWLFLNEQTDPRFRTILPYVYLPFTGIVLWPLTWFNFPTAANIWLGFNHAFVILGLALAAWAARWQWRWQSAALIAAAILWNATIERQMRAGQLNAALLLAYALVFAGIVRGWKPGIVGFLAAAAMLFKLTPGILLLWFLLTRRWRHAAWMTGWAMALLLASILLVGVDTHLGFLPVLSEMGYGKSTWADLDQTFWRDPYNQSVNSFLHHILVAFDGSTPWISTKPIVANALTWCVSLLLLGAFAVAVWHAHRPGAQTTPPTHASFAAAILLSLLLPSIFWDHYLTQALLALVLLWPLCGPRARALLTAAAVLWSLPIPLDAWIPSASSEAWQWLVVSLKLWPTLAIFALALCQTSSRPHETHP